MLSVAIYRFVINLEAGDDIALHFKPVFHSGTVAVNSMVNNGWQKQEDIEEFLFRKGQPFEVVFFVTSEGYEVRRTSVCAGTHVFLCV